MLKMRNTLNTSNLPSAARRPAALLIGLALACGGLAPAAAQSPAVPQTMAAPQTPGYTQAELDRLLAPIALYPDALLSQILMAATYPLDVAEAAAWSRRHAGLRGDDAVRAVQDREWDPSVKSLLAFPNVLERMGDNPSWVRSLGLAFLDQEPLVLETVQQLRQLARAAGSLQSDTRQHVIEDAGWVRIQPVQTGMLYVPYYDPWVVYGAWRWASYPPVVWAPWPGYVVHRARPRVLVWGPAIRISIGFFFGEIDWTRRVVMIAPVLPYYSHRVVGMPGLGRVSVQTLRPGRWEHDAARRSARPGADSAIARSASAERERLARDTRQLQREESEHQQRERSTTAERERRELVERAERERAERSAERGAARERLEQERGERAERERREQALRIERLEREQRELAARAAVQASAPPAPVVMPVQVIAPRGHGPRAPRADPQFTNSTPAPGSASAEHPPTGNPSPARQMQLEQERAARERQTTQPSPAQRLQSREPAHAREPREPREPGRPQRQRD